MKLQSVGFESSPALALPKPEWPLHLLPSIHGRLFVATAACSFNSAQLIICAGDATYLWMRMNRNR